MKFRKKPIVIDAFQMTRERRLDNSQWPNWLHHAWSLHRVEVGALFPAREPSDKLEIRTLEGVMRVSHGDFIIRGVKGELYPCKPDIFEATYESVED